MAGFAFRDGLFSVRLYGTSLFAGSMWFVPFFSTYGSSFRPLEVGYRATRVFDSGWIEYFGGQGLYWVLFNWKEFVRQVGQLPSTIICTKVKKTI